MNKATKTYNSPFPKVQAFQKSLADTLHQFALSLEGWIGPEAAMLRFVWARMPQRRALNFPPVWFPSHNIILASCDRMCDEVMERIPRRWRLWCIDHTAVAQGMHAYTWVHVISPTIFVWRFPSRSHPRQSFIQVQGNWFNRLFRQGRHSTKAAMHWFFDPTKSLSWRAEGMTTTQEPTTSNMYKNSWDRLVGTIVLTSHTQTEIVCSYGKLFFSLHFPCQDPAHVILGIQRIGQLKSLYLGRARQPRLCQVAKSLIPSTGSKKEWGERWTAMVE